MKERPILFSAPMVRAILDGRKTQTRRAIKPQPPENFMQGDVAAITNGERWAFSNTGWSGGQRGAWPPDPEPGFLCPHGKPGDQLWVRETFFAYGRWETRFSAKKGRDEWHFIDMTLECGQTYIYDPFEQKVSRQHSAGVIPDWWRRPSIFMPRAASRIQLEIVSVRVERLQDISESDAIAEGARRFDDIPIGTPSFSPCHWSMETPESTDQCLSTARMAFANLFCKVNGKNRFDYSPWDSNPWVWVVEFKQINNQN